MKDIYGSRSDIDSDSLATSEYTPVLSGYYIHPFNTTITIKDDKSIFDVKYINMLCIGDEFIPHIEFDNTTIKVCYEIAPYVDSNGGGLVSACTCPFGVNFSIDKIPAGKYLINISVLDSGEETIVVKDASIELFDGEPATVGVYVASPFSNIPKNFTDEEKSILDRYFSETDDVYFDPKKARELGIL